MQNQDYDKCRLQRQEETASLKSPDVDVDVDDDDEIGCFQCTNIKQTILSLYKTTPKNTYLFVDQR